MDLRSVDLDHH